MMTRLYPQSTGNRNVPNGVFLVASVVTMSGEITTTYYIDRDGGMWEVADWTISKPSQVSMSEMCRLTGDTERMLAGRLDSWKRHEMAEVGQ